MLTKKKKKKSLTEYPLVIGMSILKTIILASKRVATLTGCCILHRIPPTLQSYDITHTYMMNSHRNETLRVSHVRLSTNPLATLMAGFKEYMI